MGNEPIAGTTAMLDIGSIGGPSMILQYYHGLP